MLICRSLRHQLFGSTACRCSGPPPDISMQASHVDSFLQVSHHACMHLQPPGFSSCTDWPQCMRMVHVNTVQQLRVMAQYHLPCVVQRLRGQVSSLKGSRDKLLLEVDRQSLDVERLLADNSALEQVTEYLAPNTQCCLVSNSIPDCICVTLYLPYKSAIPDHVISCLEHLVRRMQGLPTLEFRLPIQAVCTGSQHLTPLNY